MHQEAGGPEAADGAGQRGSEPVNEAARRLWIVRNPSDDLVASGPVGWASQQLRDALDARGIPTDLVEHLSDAPSDGMCVAVAGRTAPMTRELVGAAGTTVPDAAEALGLISGRLASRDVVLATGSDVRGLVYAVLELADVVACETDPLQALRMQQTIVERPANPIRGVVRLFVSEVEDKPWFYDRESWHRYLSMLISHRFNRIQLALGMGVNFLRTITDAYFLFPYPFLVAVPGYNVRALGLADEERERNLDTLRFVSDQAAACGLHFELGLWTHGYAWVDSPNATYLIDGLTPENHAAYCRDAVCNLLEACPGIAGLTFRVHGESGVPEGSYDFWKEVFRGAMECGRRVELDLHPKGVDRQMIDVALQTGLLDSSRVSRSPSYCEFNRPLRASRFQSGCTTATSTRRSRIASPPWLAAMKLTPRQSPATTRIPPIRCSTSLSCGVGVPRPGSIRA